MGNHELTPVSSNEFARRMVVDWCIIDTDRQKQPVNDTEYVSRLKATDAIPGICLNLDVPAATAKQEASLAVPAGPAKELTSVSQSHYSPISKPGETLRVPQRNVHGILNNLCVTRAVERECAIQKIRSSVLGWCA